LARSSLPPGGQDIRGCPAFARHIALTDAPRGTKLFRCAT
jgi:hypothetical protein